MNQFHFFRTVSSLFFGFWLILKIFKAFIVTHTTASIFLKRLIHKGQSCNNSHKNGVWIKKSIYLGEIDNFWIKSLTHSNKAKHPVGSKEEKFLVHFFFRSHLFDQIWYCYKIEQNGTQCSWSYEFAFACMVVTIWNKKFHNHLRRVGNLKMSFSTRSLTDWHAFGTKFSAHDFYLVLNLVFEQCLE